MAGGTLGAGGPNRAGDVLDSSLRGVTSGRETREAQEPRRPEAVSAAANRKSGSQHQYDELVDLERKDELGIFDRKVE